MKVGDKASFVIDRCADCSQHFSSSFLTERIFFLHCKTTLAVASKFPRDTKSDPWLFSRAQIFLLADMKDKICWHNEIPGMATVSLENSVKVHETQC